MAGVKPSVLIEALRGQLQQMPEVVAFVEDASRITWTGETFVDLDLERAIDAMTLKSILVYYSGTRAGSPYWTHTVGIVLVTDQFQLGMDFGYSILRGNIEGIEFADSAIADNTHPPKLVTFERRYTDAGAGRWVWELKLDVEECR